MRVVEAVALGIVQGLTEFLPVSSSGHLVLAQNLFGGAVVPDVLFDVFLHVGTLAAVVVAFRAEVAGMARSLLPGGDPALRRMAGWIAAGSVPTALVGFLFRDELHALFGEPATVAAMLLVTATLLFTAERFARPRLGFFEVGWVRSVVVGAAQGVAIIPGISRSGATIATAMFLGVRPRDAARFSFLLSLPAVAGALLLEILHVGEAGAAAGAGVGATAAGMAAAFLSGLWAIRFLLRLLAGGRLLGFAIYCAVVGLGYFILAA